jgi:hypothetical protein
MSRLAQLRTLAELQATPRATRKDQLGSKLDRAIAKKAARLDDAIKLRTWAAAVKTRDQWTDRKTGQRVRSTRQLDPLRAEAHHIEPKENRAVRYDVRNGICLSFATHFLVTQHHYRIDGTAWFSKGGVTYIDATAPVYFVRL